MDYIASEWNPINDTPEAFVDDLKDMSLLPEETEAEASKFLLGFFSVIQQDNDRRLAAMYAASVVPGYSSISAVIDARPVFDKPFGSGRDDKVERHAPRFLGAVPVILLKIKLSRGDPVAFQCTEKEFSRLIEVLRAAQVDLKETRESIDVNWIDP